MSAKPASRMPVPGDMHTARHGEQRQDRKGVSGAVFTVQYGMICHSMRIAQEDNLELWLICRLTKR